MRAWQDRSRDLLRASPPSWALSSPTLRAARAGVRLVGALDRSEDRDRRDCAIALICVRLYPYMHAGPVLGCTVDPDSDLRLSG